MDIPKQVHILDIKKSYFGYQKQQFRISENKHLFQISKIVIISDIQNNYFWYLKLFSDIRNCCFLISKITFLDISNKTPFWHNFWYPK